MAMVSAMDDSVGRILAALDRAGMRRNTIVVFASDNGGDRKLGGDNGAFRAGKGTAWEGGIRVPAIARWPGGGLSGGRRVTGRVAFVDLMPTILNAVGAPASPNVCDGVDVMPLLKGGAAPRRPIFTMTGAERSESGEGGETEANPHEVMAVNEDGWKLIWRRWPKPEGPQAGWAREEYTLYRLDDDPFEQHEVAATHPDIVARLKADLVRFRALEPTDGRPTAKPSFRPPPGFKPPADWAAEPRP